MNLNTLRIFNSGSIYDRFDIICMMFDEIFEKNQEIIKNENKTLHILTDIHDITYGDKNNFVSIKREN